MRKMDYFKDYTEDIINSTECDIQRNSTSDSSSNLSSSQSVENPTPACNQENQSDLIKIISSKIKDEYKPIVVNTTPKVHLHELQVKYSQNFINPNTKILYDNPQVDAIFAPIFGPKCDNNNLSETKINYNKDKSQNHYTGNVELFYVNECAFDTEYNNYSNYGYAADPSDHYNLNTTLINNNLCTLDDDNQINRKNTFTQFDLNSGQRLAVAVGIPGGQIPKYSNKNSLLTSSSQSSKRSIKKQKIKNNRGNDHSIIDEYDKGPWKILSSSSLELENRESHNEDKNNKVPNSTETSEHKNDNKTSSTTSENVTSIFHGDSMFDYKGFSWLVDKTSDKNPPDDFYIPKKHLHSYVGHTMGVQAIRFFPETGHLLLSGSMDTKIKIWSVEKKKKKCMCTYINHSQGVRDIQFTHDGRKFYSCSYDKYINLWDTEYGKVIGRFTNNCIPYCVSVHPDESMQNVFIIGSSNKRAVQFDSNTGKIEQEYNEHLSVVNTVTFCEDNKKIVTTSDDKKIFIWDFGIPVVVKHIAEACMYSIPSVSLDPSKTYLACQSMDNQILVYEAFGKFRFQPKRKFKNHICAGYSIHPNFSPNGRFIFSGDIYGNLWFWNWSNLVNYCTLKCHDGVCIDAAWHPLKPSLVATCGWDGLIKLWD